MGKQIMLGVPGYWENRAEILAAVADRSDGFLCLANTPMDTSTKDAYTLDICHHDPRLAAAFRKAGRAWMEQPDLDRLGPRGAPSVQAGSDLLKPRGWYLGAGWEKERHETRPTEWAIQPIRISFNQTAGQHE